MNEQAPEPHEVEMLPPEEHKRRFLDLVRNVVTAPPVTEEQKQYEREYMAKHFTTKGKARVRPK